MGVLYKKSREYAFRTDNLNGLREITKDSEHIDLFSNITNETDSYNAFVSLESASNLLVASEALLSKVNDIEEVYNVVSKESLGSFITDIKAFFLNRFASLSKLFSGFSIGGSKKEVEFNMYIKQMLKKKSVIAKIKTNLKYMEVQDIKVHTIIGLKTNLLDLTSELVEALSVMKSKLPSELEELDDKLAKILGNDEYCKSTKPLGKVSSETRDQLERSLKLLIDHKGILDTTTLSKLIPNLNCLDSIVDNILSIGESSAVKTLEEISGCVSAISERCNELVTKFKYSDSKHYSKVVLEDVITRLRLNAEALTFGASLIQLSIQSATITEHLIKELEYRL